MKREVGISLFAVLIVAAAILTVYYLNVGPTGFAVVGESGTNFTGTFENTFYDANTSAVVLNLTDPNVTSGTYTSKVFNAGSSATWNNLTWQGTGVDFEARACSAEGCANINFTTANLTNLNLTGQYFQYRAAFNSANDTLTSVALDYSVPEPEEGFSVTINSPANTTHDTTEVGLNVSANKEVSSWKYNLNNGENITFIPNTTLTSLSNGSYSLIIYANSTEGEEVSASVSFSVLIPSCSNDLSLCSTREECINVGDGYWYNDKCNTSPEQVVPEIPVEQVPIITQISLGELAAQEIIQGNTEALSLPVQNTGTVPLSSCALSGDDSGWITITEGARNLAPGESASFAFSVNVPEEIAVEEYTLGLSVACAETIASRSITVNVLQKKLDFNITNVQRTRQNRVSVDYSITELAGEDQDLEIYFSIKDASGTEVANASQNRSVDANETDDFRTNIAINESINGTMTLSAAFNSQIYSSSVLEPITLGAPTGAAIFEGIGGGSIVILVVVILVLAAVLFVARRMRKGKLFGSATKD